MPPGGRYILVGAVESVTNDRTRAGTNRFGGLGGNMVVADAP